MITLDLTHFITGLWIKPTLWVVLFFSISRNVYYYCAAASHNLLVCSFVVIFMGVLIHFCSPGITLHILPKFFAGFLNYQLILPIGDVVSWQNIPILLSIVFVFGFVWICAYQILSMQDVFSLIRNSEVVSNSVVINVIDEIAKKWRLKQKIHLVQANQLTSPVVFGHRKPVLMLPKDYLLWPTTRLQRVLLHEISHIRRNDWLIKISLRFLCAVFWFVPLVWLLAEKIDWFAEVSCDDAVINELNCRAEYAEDLLNIESDNIHNAWLVSFIKATDLYARINHILDGRYSRQRAARKSTLVHTAICIAIVFPVAILHAVPIVQEMKYKKYFVVDLQKQTVEEKNYDNKTDQNTVENKRIGVVSKPAALKPLLLDHSVPNSRLEEMSITLDLKRGVNPGNAPLLLTNMIAGQGIAGELGAEDVENNTQIEKPMLVVSGFIPQKMKSPVYPRKALLNDIEGSVQIEFDISVDGMVENVKIIRSQPKGVFDDVVILAISESRYTPMHIGREAVKTKNVQQTYNFKLSESTTDRLPY